MLLKDGKEQTDLVEVFCSPTSTLTKTAQSHGLKAERWTKEDFDLSRPSGCQLAMERLRQLRPNRLWLSPECGHYSIMQNANQRPPQQAENLRKERELAFRQWQSCIRLAWLQVELGGTFYVEQPQRCMSWQLKDQKTRYLLDELSTFCIRDQCFDGLQHPKSGYPMQKGTRIQTNDISFANQFAQRCVGHDYDHVPIEGNITYGTAFYPKRFCQRAVQIWKTKMISPRRNVWKKLKKPE